MGNTPPGINEDIILVEENKALQNQRENHEKPFRKISSKIFVIIIKLFLSLKNKKNVF